MSIKIVGICLVKNEDIYIERVLKNVVNFCDQLRVVDNCSTDSTLEIAKEFASTHSNVTVEQLEDIRMSHELMQEYVGTDTWVFLIDGDEIYDPEGLARLKPLIKKGEYQKCWMVRGYFYHLVDMDVNSKKAEGYLAPPSKDPNKLYNLSLLKSWANDRKVPIGHCGTHVFKNPKYHSLRLPKKKLLYKKSSWETCMIRCVHTRMIKRSSIESFEKEEINARMNMSDNMQNRGSRGGNFRKKYRIGKKIAKDVSDFFI
jgi:glycosyltransferase involved in cell wall biosynthesis